MTKIKWKDETSYSRGEERGSKTPATWCVNLGGIELSVTRSIFYPGQWVMLVRGEFVISHPHTLNSVEAKDAKNEALNYMKKMLERILKDIGT